jgi:CspA family cold shock protein
MNGTIKKITKDRGFGFITAENGVEYFFHQSELRGGLTFDELREGQRVSFETAQSDKGPRAAEVHPA